jgi:hypothetical protein
MELGREKLLGRIRALDDATRDAFTIDGVRYGVPSSVRRLISAAIEAYEGDDLGLCESICERAETEIETRRQSPRKPAEGC